MMQENRSFRHLFRQTQRLSVDSFFIDRDSDDLESVFTNLATTVASLRNFQSYGLNQQSKIVSIGQLFTDMQNGTLPQFAYIEPAFISGYDEHTGACYQHMDGPAFAGHIIESLMTSRSSKDSIFITPVPPDQPNDRQCAPMAAAGC